MSFIIWDTASRAVVVAHMCQSLIRCYEVVKERSQQKVAIFFSWGHFFNNNKIFFCTIYRKKWPHKRQKIQKENDDEDAQEEEQA